MSYWTTRIGIVFLVLGAVLFSPASGLLPRRFLVSLTKPVFSIVSLVGLFLARCSPAQLRLFAFVRDHQ